MSDNYISKVKIAGLFTDKASHEILFDPGVNCIYGINGSGKTTVINLITACLSFDVEVLKGILFSEVIIYVTKSGNKRQLKLMTVAKKDINKEDDSDFVITFFNEGVKKKSYANYRTILGGDDVDKIIRFNVGDEEYTYPDFFNKNKKSNLKSLMKNVEDKIRLTHLPLTRMHATDAYDFSSEKSEILYSLKRNGVSRKDIAKLLDTSTQVLYKLEERFVALYGRKQDEINKELESLKQKILNKLLIEESQLYISTNEVLDKAVSYKYDLNDIIKQLHDTDIFPEKDKVIEHFEVWERAVRELNEAKKDFEKNSKNDEFDFIIMERYMDAHSRALSFSSTFERFFNVINDVKEMQERKEIRMSVFNTFKKVVNSFLYNKKFSYSEDMKFIIIGGGLSDGDEAQNIILDDLSSGEKHVLAILGRVALQEEKSSVFIADEPELSLHLEWQRKILPAVRKLSPDMQVIVATHSPAIIPKDAKMIDIEECVIYG